MRGSTGASLGRRALVAGAALTITVSGCTGDPEQPSTLPSSSSSSAVTSPSESPTTATPRTPREQVEAAVRIYYDELTKAAQTGETKQLRQLVDRGCPCFGAVRSIEDVEAKGYSTPEAAWTVDSIHVREVGKTQALVEVRYRVNAHDLVGPEGERRNRFSAKRRHLDLSLTKRESGWTVSNLFDLET